MKRLLSILSVTALATGVFADPATVESATETFEDMTTGVNVTTNTPTPNAVDTFVWSSAGNADEGETGTVTEYGDGEAKPANGALSNDKYLTISTTTGTPLYRSVAKHNGTKLPADLDSVDIGDGIYVDTFVQFSGSETAPQIPEGSKLVVWVQAIDFDDNSTPEDDTDDTPGSTNLIVTAAQLDASGNPTATNFVIATANNFDFEGWHRLTIRAIKDITDGAAENDKVAGFTVFVDEVQLAADSLAYGELMGAFDYDGKLSMEAKKFYNANQLFVSLAGTKGGSSGATAQTLSAVGFDGTGKVDDVTVTTTAPAYAKGDYYFTVGWSQGVTGFTLKDGENVITNYIAAGSGTEMFEIPKTASTLTITNVMLASGYTLTGGEADYTLGEVITASITAEATLAYVNGVGYTSLEAAITAAAANGYTIELARSFTLNEVVLSNGDVVIDLHGYSLEYEVADSDNAYLFAIQDGASLKIYDSVGGGAVKYADGEESEALIVAETGGQFTLGDIDESDKGATISGFVYVESEAFIRGKIKCIEGSNCEKVDDEYVPTEAVSNYLYVDSHGNRSTITAIEVSEEPYFEITPPEPTYEISVTAPANATAAIYVGDPEAAYTVPVVSGTVYRVVVTPDAGYTYVGVDLSGTGWTLEGSTIELEGEVGDDDVEITGIPAPVVPTYDVTVTDASHASYTSTPAGLTGLTAGTVVTIVATADTDYTYTGVSAAGWEIAADGNTATNTFTISDNVAVTILEPVADTPPASTFDVTVTGTANANYTSTPAVLTGLAADTPVTIVATANKGYTYDGVSAVGWTVASDGATATNAFTIVDQDVAVAIPAPAMIVPVPGEQPEYETEADAQAAAAAMDVPAADKTAGVTKDDFKTTVVETSEGWKVVTELDEAVVQPSTDAAVTNAAFIANVAATAVGQQANLSFTGLKPGLTYGVEYTTNLGAFTSTPDPEKTTWGKAGTDGTLSLKLTKPTGNAVFFKVHVKYVPAE